MKMKKHNLSSIHRITAELDKVKDQRDALTTAHEKSNFTNEESLKIAAAVSLSLTKKNDNLQGEISNLTEKLRILKAKYKEERDIWDDAERLRNEEYKKELETILENNEKKEKDLKRVGEEGRVFREGKIDLQKRLGVLEGEGEVMRAENERLVGLGEKLRGESERLREKLGKKEAKESALKEDVKKLTSDKNLLEETVLSVQETIDALKKEKNDQDFQGTQLESRFEEFQSKITQARSELDRSEKNCRELESLASEKNLELEQCMHS